ncbi:MAG: virulence RhuM family protein [Selenomonadaceae bacterium]|nr:virulence RhuM family protein [Selenomonadaceae bacterium]
MMNKELQFLIYSTPEENVLVDVVVKDEDIWVTQKAMAELFGVKVPAISKHLKNIFEEGELQQESTISKMETVQNEGVRSIKGLVDFYNLDAIISVGYRVNSHKATKFRIWATQILKEYMQKGFAMDDERLKQGKTFFGKDYLDYIEDLIERENTFNMEQFSASINEFLAFRRYDILPAKGKVSHKEAVAKAHAEYDIFNKNQRIVSDFDLFLQQAEKLGGEIHE